MKKFLLILMVILYASLPLIVTPYIAMNFLVKPYEMSAGLRQAFDRAKARGEEIDRLIKSINKKLEEIKKHLEPLKKS